MAFKGSVFYLTTSLDSIWSLLQLAFLPLFVTAFCLMFLASTLEYRLKRRVWDQALGEIARKRDGPSEE